MPEQVKCPFCKQRLFDLKTKTTGAIDIKCPKCKAILAIELNNYIIIRKKIVHTEQRSQ